jgi:hypothetical protein
MSVLMDRGSGRCIITTAWETDEAMRASAEKASRLRDRAAEKLGGNVEKIEEWEIAALHRDHRSRDGACTRATWVKSDPARADQNIEYYKTSVLPEVENLDGFCRALALKTAKIREAGVEELDEREFELALAHLRVPELA